MKKLLALFLTCAMLLSLSLAPVFAKEGETEDPETETDYSDYIEVTSPDQIFTESALPGKYVLKNDLDMTGVTKRVWLTGGTVIDGNGHSLINCSGKEVFALLSAGTVRNLTIGSAEAPIALTNGGLGNDDATANILWENVSVYATSVSAQTGCFLVNPHGKHTFRNCTVTIDAECPGGGNIGGWIGYVVDATAELTWENCATYGSLTATESGRVGGYIANITTAGKYTFTNCANYASITTVTHAAAGFVAHGDVSSTPVLTMTGCKNYGAITATTDGESYAGYAGLIGHQTCPATLTDCANYGAVTGSLETGGLIGYANSQPLTLTNCENYGRVYGKQKNVGGLIGLTDKATVNVIGCINYGEVASVANSTAGIVGWVQGGTVTITETTNRGPVTSAGNTAGFVAEANGEVTIEKCLNTGAISATGDHVGGFIGYSDVCSLLNECANIGSVTLEGGSRCASLVGGGDTKLTGCLALGSVNGPAADAFVGGEAGYWAKESESTGNSYWDNGVTPAIKVSGATKLESAEDAIAALGTTYGFTFMTEQDGKVLVIATPELSAVQETEKDANEQFKVRFVAAIDSLNYKYVGFKVKTAVGDAALTERDDQYCQYVYRALVATENDAKTRYEATNLGGRYIYALSINKIPANGRVTLEITPFAVGADETQYLGTAYTIVYENGSFVSITPVVGD